MTEAEEQEFNSLIQCWQNDPAERARIDGKLAAAEARGGKQPHNQVFTQLAARIAALKAQCRS